MKEQKGSLSTQTLSWVTLTGTNRIVLTLSHIVTLAVLARLLTPEEFGIYAAAMIFLDFGASTLGDGGFPTALVQRKEITSLHVRNALAGTMATNAVMALVIFLLSAPAAVFFEMPPLRDILLVLSVIALFNGFSSISVALLQREKRFRRLVASDLFASVIGSSLVAIAFAWAGFGVWALIYGLIARVVIQTIIVWSGAPYMPIPKITREMRQLLGFSSGVSLSFLLNRLSTNIDNIIVGRILGADALGIYSRVYRFLMVPVNVFGTGSNMVIMPIFAQIQDDRERIRRGYCRALALTSLLVLPFILFVIHAADGVVLVMLGPQWTAAIVPIQILVSTVLFRLEAKTFVAVAKGLGRSSYVVLYQACLLATVAMGAGLGVRWGLNGVTTGVAVAVVLSAMLSIVLVHRLCGLTARDYLYAHGPSAALFSVLLVLVELGSRFAWPDVSPVFSMILDGVIIAIAGYVLCRWKPRIFLGADGIWFMRQIGERLPRSARWLLPTR